MYLLCDLTTPLLEGSRPAWSSPCGCSHHGRRHCGHTGACWHRRRRRLGTLARVVAVASSLLEGLGHRCCHLRPRAVSIVALPGHTGPALLPLGRHCAGFVWPLCRHRAGDLPRRGRRAGARNPGGGRTGTGCVIIVVARGLVAASSSCGGSGGSCTGIGWPRRRRRAGVVWPRCRCRVTVVVRELEA